MIQINLLPQAMRPRRSTWRKPSVTPRQAVVGTVVAFSFVTACLWIWRSRLDRAMTTATAGWETLQASKVEVDLHRRSVASLERQAQRLSRLRPAEVTWAARLNLLSDAAAPQVWFTRLEVAPVEVKRGKGPGFAKGQTAKGRAPPAPQARRVQMTVTGVALVAGGTLSPLGTTLEALKRHPEFPRLFDRVEIKSAQRRTIGSLDVTEFTLVFEAREVTG